MASYSEILTAYKTELEGRRNTVGVNLDVILNTPRVIPEHTQIFVEIDALVGQMAEITDKLKIVNFLLQQNNQGD